jgi:hypothetical protein
MMQNKTMDRAINVVLEVSLLPCIQLRVHVYYIHDKTETIQPHPWRLVACRKRYIS